MNGNGTQFLVRRFGWWHPLTMRLARIDRLKSSIALCRFSMITVG